jgi:hypothetical protein
VLLLARMERRRGEAVEEEPLKEEVDAWREARWEDGRRGV